MLRIHSGANSTMKTETKSAREEGDQDRAAGDQDRAPDQRPGVEGVDVVRRRPGRRGRSALSWSSTLPPAPNQARPLWANDGQAVDEDGDDQRQQQRRRRHRPARRASARRAGPTTSGRTRGGTPPPSALLLGLLVEGGDAAGLGDHFAGQRAAPRPVDELLQPPGWRCRRSAGPGRGSARAGT